MAFKHGKSTVIKVGTTTFTPWVKTSTFERDVDQHDVTGGGASAHAYFSGLDDGTFTMSGTYDDTATGPHDTFKTGTGGSYSMTWQPEGTGTGLPQAIFTGALTKYVETAPVDGVITWSADFKISGTVTIADQ